MANIGVRSPYFVNYTNATGTALSSKIEISIKVTEAEGFVLRYTIIKNTGQTVRLDISELVRDYIVTTYEGSLDTTKVGKAAVTVDVAFYDALNATGTGLDTDQDTFTAYDGYRYFSEGNNFPIPSGNLLSSTTIYAPVNTSGSFYVMTAGGTLDVITYSTGATSANGITIKRQPCDKYDPVKVVFINKFGVHQDFYFFAKKTDSFNTNGEKYSSNIVGSNGTFSSSAHQMVDFNKNGKISYNLSTGYISETDNAYIQELMLSEQVWLNLDGTVIPVNVNTSSVQYKTSLNDKLVAYTMDFEQSNDIISTIK